MQKCAFFRRFFTTTQQVTVASQIGDLKVNLCIELYILYIDQFVVPPIFKYLIGAKDVEIRLARKFDSAERAPSTKVSIDLEFINPIWLGCLGCLPPV